VHTQGDVPVTTPEVTATGEELVLTGTRLARPRG
jgi:hypothetical protein